MMDSGKVKRTFLIWSDMGGNSHEACEDTDPLKDGDILKVMPLKDHFEYVSQLETERDELKGKLGKAVEALTWYSKHKIGVCRTECGTGLYEQVASEALKEISK